MIDSLKKNKTGILLMLLSSIFACVGQMMWKLATTGSIWYLIIGFGLYGIGALVMLIAYKFGSLSVLQPVLSMNYVLALLLGFFVFNETISLLRILGVVTIVTGVVFIGLGD